MPSQRRASNKRPPRPPTKKTSPSGADPTAAATPAASSSSSSPDIQVPSTATDVDDDGFGSSTDDAVAEAAASADTGTTDGAAGNGALVGETAGNGGRADGEASNTGSDSASTDSGASASGNGVALSTNGDEGFDEDPSAVAADDLAKATEQIPDTPATAAAAAGTPRTPTATDKPRPTKTISPTSKTLSPTSKTLSPTSKTLSPTSKTLSPTSKALSSSNKPPAGAAKSGQSGATGKAGNQTNGAPANSGSPRTATKAPASKSAGAGKAATGKGGSSTSTQPAPKSPRPQAGTGGPAYRPPTGQARAASRRPPPPKRKKSRFTRKTISAVVGLCLIAAIVVFFALAVNGSGTGTNASVAATGPENIPIPSGPTLAAAAGSAYGPTIDGVQCQTSEQVAYHIHVHLTIFVNGKAQQIPYGIGIAPPVHTTTQNGGAFVDGGTCYYWLHTHAADGIIHIESPTSTVYTLGTFFDIWEQTLNANQVGPAQGKVTVYQNGKLYTGDPRQVMLTAHNQIQLDVGTNTPPKPLITNWGSL